MSYPTTEGESQLGLLIQRLSEQLSEVICVLVVFQVPPNAKTVVPRNKVIMGAVFQLL